MSAAALRCPHCGAAASPAGGAQGALAQRADHFQAQFVETADRLVAAPNPFARFAIDAATVFALDVLCDAFYGSAGMAPGDAAWRPSQMQMVSVVNHGVLFGEIIRRTLGGRWTAGPGGGQDVLQVRLDLPAGVNCYPLQRSLQRMRDGAERGFELLFNELRAKLRNPPSPAEAAGWQAQAEFFARTHRPEIAITCLQRAGQIDPGLRQALAMRISMLEEAAKAKPAAESTSGAGDPSTAAGGGPSTAPASAAGPTLVASTAGVAATATDPTATDARAEDGNYHAEAIARWLARAHDYADKGETGAAMEAYRTVLTINPRHPEALREMTVGHAELGLYDDALRYATQAIAVDPQDPRVFDNLAITLARMKCFKEGLEAIESGLDLHPGAATLWKRKGVLATMSGDAAAGLPAFDEAARLDPTSGEIAAMRADCLHRVGRRAEAIAAAAALLADPSRPLSARLRTSAEAMLARWRGAA